MNAFELYLILKLDDFIIAGFLFGFLGFLGLGAVAMITDCDIFVDEDLARGLRWWKCGVVCVALCWLAAVFLPSTKQVAAIYVLSALTQDETVETIKSESGELYELFKAWLRNEIEESAPVAEEAGNG